jgi:DNA-binding transcriptional ArsR family regulator
MSFALFEAIFGSKVRARLIRFFILNAEQEYTAAEISEKVLLSKSEVSRELLKLKKMGFVRENARKRVKAFQLHPSFPFTPELHSLVSKSNVNIPHQMFQKLRAVGEVKLVLISGVFLNFPKGKADIILVVNNVSRQKLKGAIERLEAEVGRDIRFVLMDGEELHYRLNMLDRFLIEFLEGPYQEIVNRVPELKRFIAGLKK